MAVYYYPFESHETGDESNPYDRAITAEQERMFNKLRYVNGVFNPDGGALRVTSNSNMTVTVGTGGCHIEGAIAYNDAPITLQIEAADATLNRIDRVVAQFNTSDSVRAISILVRTGTAATNPIAPELRTEPNLYEIALADVYVGKNVSSIGTANITDQRLNSALCGQVVPAIPIPLDLTGIYDQYQASLNEWLDTVASALDETLAGNLQSQITALDERMTAEEGKVQPVSLGGTGKTTNTANSVLVGNGASAIKNIASANGALYATSANGDPKFGTLPIAQGGTGATTIANAQKNLQLDENYVILGMNADVNLSTTESKIAFNKTVRNKGELLSVSSNGVKIGAGVSRVKISANISLNPRSSSTATELIRIWRNNTMTQHYFPAININGGASHTSIAEYEIEVSEGDVIYLYGSTSVSGVGRVINSSQFKVEVVR